jgi:hypothetical protein
MSPFGRSGGGRLILTSRNPSAPTPCPVLSFSMTHKASIMPYVQDPADIVRKCAVGDEKIAEIVFTHPNGAKHYTCEMHAMSYLLNQTTLMAALIMKHELSAQTNDRA